MVIFEELKKQLFWIGGLQWDSESETKYRSVCLLCLAFVICITFSISCIWFLLFDIHPPAKHAKSYYFSSFSILLFVWLFKNLLY